MPLETNQINKLGTSHFQVYMRDRVKEAVFIILFENGWMVLRFD